MYMTRVSGLPEQRDSQSIDDLLIIFPHSMEDDELPSADGMGGRGSLPAAQCHGGVLRL